MASLSHLSARLGLTLSLGTVDGKAVTKSISVSRLSAAFAGNATSLNALVGVVGNCLEHPVATVKLYDTKLLSA